MLRDGFLRFCDNPEIACCKAERELEQLRAENASLRAQLAESQRRERAAVEERDTLMRRYAKQVEIIRHKIDCGGFTPDEQELLDDLMLPRSYDRRGPQEAGEGEAE